MRILVDMDDVLCHFVPRIVEWYNKDTNSNIKLKNVDPWDLEKSFKDKAALAYFRNYIRYPSFYQDLPPVEGAIEGFKKLVKKYDVFIVSAVPRSAGLAYEGKMEWLRFYFPFFNLDNFISAQKKSIIESNILLDDGMHNLEPFRESGKTAVAFDRPWNKKWDGLRVKTWPEFLDLVKELKKGR